MAGRGPAPSRLSGPVPAPRSGVTLPPLSFATVLSAAGRRVLEGRDPALCGALADPRRRFVAARGLIGAAAARELRRRLETYMLPALERMDTPIPPDTIWGMRENYGELLPKVARVWTAYLESRRSAGWKAARAIGLVDLLGGADFHAFAQRLAGRPLRPAPGLQVLCYGPGDYAGPHNDHHPENEETARGYVDIHVTLPTPAVAHQYLVYAKAGHFTEMVEVTALGGVTAYRLPFWHYTTPLMARPGREAEARRWVLLGTFLYA